MPWFTKKKKEEGKFRLFRPYSTPISAVFGIFRPYRPLADITQYAKYGPILAESARFGVNWSRFGTNRAASARIESSRREFEKKKKKQIRTDAQATASDTASHVAPHWTQVPHSCFLETKYHSYLSKKKKKKKLSLQVYIKNRWKLNAIISLKKARKLCSFQVEIILRHTNHLLITKTVHIFQKTITLFQTILRGREIERTHAHKRK